ncbi:sulfate reduction electron transfer complex DsrMKJOP subunit DsrO [Desulfatibacillum aliphaticivorans]|uniref:sulfate reduction electron transfer complex DsrMKJOP subunit DsrO n=1 Tax=Desulfatibacillum aliphaticivorans TaxID=218208 RepID=UPI000426B3B9|nr:4Fe-4S dicluster domain-containing protein [Desulfatibacillum aliphaticivorans]
MKSDRRHFLKAAGVATIGVAAGATAAEANLLDSAKELLLGPKGAAPYPEAKKNARWAMVVDTRKLTAESMEKMIHACNHAHNIPLHPLRKKGDKYNKDEIKWIWEEEFENAFPGQMNEHLPPKVTQNEVLVLCNQCENPACVRVCPTKATFQRDDGIVIMDFHRCIGCRFCMAACPYGSRSFNFKDPRIASLEINPEFPTRMKGVVEKCNFCAEQLDKGLQPHCVEACENGELVFGDMNDPESEIRKVLRNNYTIRRKPEVGTQPQVYYIV